MKFYTSQGVNDFHKYHSRLNENLQIKNKEEKDFCSMINDCQPTDILICFLTAHDKSKCPYYHKILREKYNLKNHNTTRDQRDKRKNLNLVIIEKKQCEVNGEKIDYILVKYDKEKV